jgi:hypothetical protein
MQHSGEPLTALRQLIAQVSDLIFEFDIANLNVGRAQQLCHALPTLFAADRIDNVRADVFQRFADMIGHAFLVRDAKDDKRLCGLPH